MALGISAVGIGGGLFVKPFTGAHAEKIRSGRSTRGAAGQPSSLGEMSPQVRPAKKADIADLSQTMARAFYDDPIMTWILPDAETRLAKLNRLFATMTRHHHLAAGGVEVACGGPGHRRGGIVGSA